MKNDTLEENLYLYILFKGMQVYSLIGKKYPSDLENNLNAKSNQRNFKLLNS